MTNPNSTKLADLIEKARNGCHVLWYKQAPLPDLPACESGKLDWRSMLRSLFAKWATAGAEIRGVSFIFTDAPYHLSRFVFDAVITWDGEEFRRAEISELPESFRAALSTFEETVQRAILCKVGDAVAAMADLYGHQLLCGQGFLTLETLTVLNVDGRTMSNIAELGPTLLYSINSLMTGSYDEAVACHPECIEPGGAFELVQWISDNTCRLRVSEEHVQACINTTLCPLPINSVSPGWFHQVVEATRSKEKTENCETG
jgi:hypothetical protein